MSFQPGDIVVVAPKNGDDPIATEHRGERVILAARVRGAIFDLWRTNHAKTKARVTYRECDLKPEKETQ